MSALRLDVLAQAYAHSPTPALLSMPPTSPRDRASYVVMLERLAEQLRATPPSPSALAAVAVMLPFDGGRLLEAFESIGRGTALAVLTAIVDTVGVVTVAHLVDGNDAGAVEEKRLQRACDVLCGFVDGRGTATLLRVVATSAGRRGARSVVRALFRSNDPIALCEVVDTMTAAQQATLLPLLLAEVPPIAELPRGGLRGLFPRSSSRTLQVLLARPREASNRHAER